MGFYFRLAYSRWFVKRTDQQQAAKNNNSVSQVSGETAVIGGLNRDVLWLVELSKDQDPVVATETEGVT